MATDAAVVNAVDASVPPDAKLNAPTGLDPRNASPDRASLNGSPSVDEISNKHITNVEDQVNSADVSVSGGSDTEASKGDSTKSKDGDKGHARTSSAKKPATFKAVSVNKTFLASKSATASHAASKPMEKPAASSTLSSTTTGASGLSGTRPRLVAKSGSGTGSPRFSSVVNGNKQSGGPDPNAVWNKNKPTPAPDPKKLSDEELKKYGIHMASRLGPETNQNHDNWADIDDDDEDWAPDSITWTDGTKVTLPQPSEDDPTPHPQPPQEPGRDAVPPREKSKSPAPVAAREKISPKPGVMTAGKGLVLKGAPTEKPTNVAKPQPTTTASKSPWAKLPPVEKVSPVGTENMPQMLGSHPPKEHDYNTSPPLTREIAADDFNRSTWREGSVVAPRELYNSQSGRYEPVGDRRGSMRSDAHRQPAVLQRPSQSDHPEPSAAFQTSRNTHEGHFGRRRGSSNVSGGAYPPSRPSFGPHDASSNLRRGSITASNESPLSPQARHISPEGFHSGPRSYSNQQWQQPHASPAADYASVQQAPSVDPAQAQKAQEQNAAEEYELQKKIMHEKREAAMQRRREEEAREEAERKKRIQAKLDAMGPAPERKSAKKETASETSGPHVPVQIQQRRMSEHAQASAPSVESTSGAARQSGSPRGGDHDSKLANDQSDSPKDPGTQHLRGQQDVKAAPAHSEPPSGSLPSHLPGRPEAKTAWGPPANSQPDRFASWGPPSQQPTSNVWAPNDSRGLGNGTFNTSLGRAPVSPRMAASHPSRGPTPIAPPSAQRAPNTQVAPNIEGGVPEASAIRNRWGGNAVLENDRILLEQSRARMAEHERQLAERGMTLADSVPEIKDTWRPTTQHASLKNAPDATARGPPTAPSTRADLAHHGRVTPPHAAGFVAGSASILPPGSSAPQARPSRFFPARDARPGHAAPMEPERSNSPSPPPPDAASHPAFDGDSRRPHVSLPRPQPVVRLPPSARADESHPPPPRRGQQFSWASPLPFKDSGAPPSGPTGRGRRASHEWDRVAARGTGHNAPQQSIWNQKIRSLFSDQQAPAGNKMTSTPSASVVDASSKSSLDSSSHGNVAATVSLPRQDPEQAKNKAAHFVHAATAAQCHFTDAQQSFIVKPLSEECFEEQEMGSLPAVRVPRDAPDALWHPSSPPPKDRNGPRRFGNADVMSMPQLWVPQDMSTAGNPEYRIMLPGMTAYKSVAAPALRTRSNPRRGGSSRSHRGSHGGRGGKTGDAASHTGDGSSSSRSHGRGGRGGYRGRGSDWSRKASTPVV